MKITVALWVSIAAAVSNTILWDTEEDGDWDVAGNWSQEQVPTKKKRSAFCRRGVRPVRVHIPIEPGRNGLIRDEGGIESTVSELADKSGLCASRRIPLFQEQIGMTITDFRNRQKLEQFLDAYRRDGQFNMLGAALDAGFGSYAQFYRVFKKTMRQSPREYFSDPSVPG